MYYAGITPYETCSKEANWSELGDQRDLDFYCNSPHLPVTGSEGMLCDNIVLFIILS